MGALEVEDKFSYQLNIINKGKDQDQIHKIHV